VIERTKTPLRILVHVKYCGDQGCWSTNTVVIRAAGHTNIVVIRVAGTQIF
jgi:hypothetical protein